MAGMSSRIRPLVLALAVAAAGVLALGAAHVITGHAAPQLHTIYCRHWPGLPAHPTSIQRFSASVPTLGVNPCPPGFRPVSG